MSLRSSWNSFKLGLYRFNHFMRGVPILGIPWRISMLWTDKEAFYDLALGYADEISETIDDAAYIVKNKTWKDKDKK